MSEELTPENLAEQIVSALCDDLIHLMKTYDTKGARVSMGDNLSNLLNVCRAKGISSKDIEDIIMTCIDLEAIYGE